MKQMACQNEDRVLEALGQGLAPEGFEKSLREHVADCDACKEIVALVAAFQSDNAELQAAAPVPEAGVIWWRASLAARRAAAERAMRPIAMAEKAAWAVGAAVLIALAAMAAPWLARQLERPETFYGLSLPVLFAASALICLLVAAAGIYTLWAEK